MFEKRSVTPRGLALIAAALPMTLLAPRPAPAQWAVVDAPAIVQLVQEVQTMQQEVQTARDQLTQANHALQTMTGGRGMQWLLAGTVRNYLPVTWPQLADAMHGASGAYPALASNVRSAVLDNAVLTAQQLASLSPGSRERINAARQTGAAQQALARQALSNSSGRFMALQALISAIPTASDQKGILDLQARIGAELAMLQNEQTKLQILHQGMLAQQSVNEERERELAIAEQGDFAGRFRPTL